MSSETEDNPDNKKETAEGWVTIKDRSRRCTDCLCLGLIIACWVAMTIVGFAAIGIIKYEYIKPGDPMRLIHAIDYDGRICGYDSDVKNKPIGYYMATSSVVCVKKCPTKTDFQQFICQDNATNTIDSNSNNAAEKTAKSWYYVSAGQCMYHVESSEVAYRCVATGAIDALLLNQSSTTSNIPTKYADVSAVGGWFNQYISDIMTLQGYVFGFGLGVAVGVSFLYLYVLRIPGLMFTVVWTAVFSILIVLVIGTILLSELVSTWEEEGVKTKMEILVVKAFMWIGVALSSLYFCLILVLRKRIMLALGIIKEAGRALATMPSLIFLPVFQCIGLVMFLIPWFIYMLYLASSGEIVTVTVNNPYSTNVPQVSYRQMQYDTNTKYAFLYLLFCWFWTSQFIIAIGQIIVAMAIVCWYFSRPEEKSQIGQGTVIWAARVSLMYNSGTAAFGSLIIAIMSTIRAIITYIQSKAAASKNRLAVAILCCIKCCIWCIEKCIKFLNKNAYIQTAIHGYSFCKAARSAFFLLLRNILRVAAVNMVSGFVIIIGKVMIPSVTTILFYLAIIYGNSSLSSDINGIIAPVVTVFLLSYFVSCMFNELFGMAIETILLCYIADEEMFPVTERYAEGDLQESITKTAQSAASAKIHMEEDTHNNNKENSPSKPSAADNNVQKPKPATGDILL